MANTLPGTPYVESSDLVANYPAVSESLAERVDLVGILPFATSTARGTALPAPTDGQYTYLQDTNSTEFWNGSAWQSAGIDPGLRIVSPTSIANSGGSASASGGEVTFTGVSSVSLNGVFTSAYQNYKILFNAIGSTTSVLKMRMRASGSDNTSSNYIYQHLIANGATITSDRVTATQFYPTVIGTANPIGFEIIMTNPYITDKTLFQSVSFDGWQPQLMVAGGTTTVTTQYDGFTFFMDSGNMTGIVRVYGYKNS